MVCLGGTYGLCASDKVDCQALPWYSYDLCKGDTFIEARANGCVNCPNLRSICATSCKWCTPDGVAKTTTTTIKPTTYSVYAGNLLNRFSSSWIFSHQTIFVCIQKRFNDLFHLIFCRSVYWRCFRLSSLEGILPRSSKSPRTLWCNV